MNAYECSDCVRCQQLMEQPLTNRHEENYIVATADDLVIATYSMSFRKRGYTVNVIDLTAPARSNVTFDALHQINTELDAKWFAQQLDAPWLQDDPYWLSQAAKLVAYFIRVLKYVDPNAYISELVEMMNELYAGIAREGKIPAHIEELIDSIIADDPQNELIHDLNTLFELPAKTIKEICKCSCSILRHYFRYTDNTVSKNCPAFEPRSLTHNKTLLLIRIDPTCNERSNCACIIFKQIAKTLYDYIRETENQGIPIRTNFVCGPSIFHALCCDILGDSIAPHLGLHLIFALPHGEYGGVSQVLDRALHG